MEKAIAGREAVSSLDRRRRFRCNRPWARKKLVKGRETKMGGGREGTLTLFWRARWVVCEYGVEAVDAGSGELMLMLYS